MKTIAFKSRWFFVFRYLYAMKKIIAFAGSNSSTSINHKLVVSIAKNNIKREVEVIKLTDYPLPIYDEDLEKDSGFPKELEKLLAKLQQAEGVVVSVNEHNSGVSAFFKNTLDWLSRIEKNFLADKKVMLLSASPGGRGGLSAYEYTYGIVARYGGEVVAGTTFPNFQDNFSSETSTITNHSLLQTVNDEVEKFEAAL